MFYISNLKHEGDIPQPNGINHFYDFTQDSTACVKNNPLDMHDR